MRHESSGAEQKVAHADRLSQQALRLLGSTCTPRRRDQSDADSATQPGNGRQNLPLQPGRPVGRGGQTPPAVTTASVMKPASRPSTIPQARISGRFALAATVISWVTT